LRKIGDKKSVVQISGGRDDFPAVEVERIAHGLERVKGDSDREHNVEGVGVNCQAAIAQERSEIGDKKIAVFEKKKDNQINSESDRKKEFCGLPVFGVIDSGAAQIVCGYGNKHEQQETDIPCAIKDATGGQEHSVLPTMGQDEVKSVDNKNEKKKLCGVKKHGGLILIWLLVISPRIS
jgi:hypothetical protein